MSSTSGHGTGSNQQTGESLLIEAADCQFVSEIMQAIERKVLDYYDGEEAEALVYGQIKGPSLDDAAQELRVDEFAVKYGVRLSIKDWAERHNRALADEDEPVLKTAPHASSSAEGHHEDDDDGQAVNFNPNEPRDAHGRWTAGAGVGRKGPKAKGGARGTDEDDDGLDHLVYQFPKAGDNPDARMPDPRVDHLPLARLDGDPAKAREAYRLMSAKGERVDIPEDRRRLHSADAKTEPMDPDIDYPGEDGVPKMYLADGERPVPPHMIPADGERPNPWPVSPDPSKINIADMPKPPESIAGSDLVKALQRGEMRYKDLQKLELSDAEIESVTKVLQGRKPFWTAEQIKAATGLGTVATGLMRQSRADPLREQYPGLSDDEIAAREAHRRNALQAKMSLFKFFGGRDMERYKGMGALARLGEDQNPRAKTDMNTVIAGLDKFDLSKDPTGSYLQDIIKKTWRPTPRDYRKDPLVGHIQDGADMLEGLNIARGGKSFAEHATDHDVSAHQLFYEWAHGLGPNKRTFDENSVMGRDMLKTDYVTEGMNKALENARKGIFDKVEVNRSLGDDGPIASLFTYPPDFIWDAAGINQARAFQGSIHGSVTAGKPYTNEKGTFVPMEIRLYDVNGAVSGTRGAPGFGGYGDKKKGPRGALTMDMPKTAEEAESRLSKKKDGDDEEVAGLVKQNDPYGPNGPLRTLYTTYTMHQDIPIDSPPLPHSPPFWEAAAEAGKGMIN